MRKKELGFTTDEDCIMNNIVCAHLEFQRLDAQHPSDLPEWVAAIHTLQQLMGLRILRREHPELFPIKA
jgi:hypothetical protein